MGGRGERRKEGRDEREEGEGKSKKGRGREEGRRRERDLMSGVMSSSSPTVRKMFLVLNW